VEPKTFIPPQTPFPGARDGQKIISWRWSLPFPTNQFGEDRYTQFRVIVVTDPPTYTHTPTHKQTDRTDYNTLHHSIAQCNQTTFILSYDEEQLDISGHSAAADNIYIMFTYTNNLSIYNLLEASNQPTALCLYEYHHDQ